MITTDPDRMIQSSITFAAVVNAVAKTHFGPRVDDPWSEKDVEEAIMVLFNGVTNTTKTTRHIVHVVC
jgi:hypothetical protein